MTSPGVDPSIYPPGVVNPTVPSQPETPYPPMPDIPSNPPVGSTGPIPGTAPSTSNPWKQFLIWIGALGGLWLILTMAQEAGYPAFAHGMAALILCGSLLALGPKAFTNAQQLLK